MQVARSQGVNGLASDNLLLAGNSEGLEILCIFVLAQTAGREPFRCRNAKDEDLLCAPSSRCSTSRVPTLLPKNVITSSTTCSWQGNCPAFAYTSSAACVDRPISRRHTIVLRPS